MRLLTPTEVKGAVRQTAEESRRKAVAAAEVLDRETKKLNDLRTNKAREIDAMELEADAKCQALLERKRSLESEVGSLEQRKREAQKPLDELSKFLESRARELHEREKEVQKGLSEITAREEAVRGALKISGSIRQEADERLKAADTRESQAARIIADAKSVYAKTKANAQKSESALSERSMVLDAKEEELRGRESALLQGMRWVEDQKAAMAAEQSHMASQAQSLKSAFDEARKKNLL